jgi:hypothetical protein
MSITPFVAFVFLHFCPRTKSWKAGGVGNFKSSFLPSLWPYRCAVWFVLLNLRLFLCLSVSAGSDSGIGRHRHRPRKDSTRSRERESPSIHMQSYLSNIYYLERETKRTFVPCSHFLFSLFLGRKYKSSIKEGGGVLFKIITVKWLSCRFVLVWTINP